MKKHKLKNILHCPRCFDKAVKRVLEWDKKRGLTPYYIMLSPSQYKACKKYGYPEGLLHVRKKIT